VNKNGEVTKEVTMKNHANNLAMLLMALIAFTFFACEEKEKKAEAAVEASEAEYDPVAECPSKTSPLQTAEATFLETQWRIYEYCHISFS
jgi:TRAP-type C4-dicarboxylate transport system substrate-binding protein